MIFLKKTKVLRTHTKKLVPRDLTGDDKGKVQLEMKILIRADKTKGMSRVLLPLEWILILLEVTREQKQGEFLECPRIHQPINPEVAGEVGPANSMWECELNKSGPGRQKTILDTILWSAGETGGRFTAIAFSSFNSEL